jgi:hypothetical protein
MLCLLALGLGLACQVAQASGAAPAASATTRPVGTCALKSPPASARVQPGQGVDILVWPDRVDDHFTGCQKAWLEDGRLLGTTVFNQGQVQSFTAREPKGGATLRCRYQGAAADKPLPAKCPPREAFPLWR